jgi:hypothetical protein
VARGVVGGEHGEGPREPLMARQEAYSLIAQRAAMVETKPASRSAHGQKGAEAASAGMLTLPLIGFWCRVVEGDVGVSKVRARRELTGLLGAL